jgi:hypothetical protein
MPDSPHAINQQVDFPIRGMIPQVLWDINASSFFAMVIPQRAQ